MQDKSTHASPATQLTGELILSVKDKKNSCAHYGSRLKSLHDFVLPSYLYFKKHKLLNRFRHFFMYESQEKD